MVNKKFLPLEKMQPWGALLRASGDERAFLRPDAGGTYPRGSWNKTGWVRVPSFTYRLCGTRQILTRVVLRLG